MQRAKFRLPSVQGPSGVCKLCFNIKANKTSYSQQTPHYWECCRSLKNPPQDTLYRSASAMARERDQIVRAHDEEHDAAQAIAQLITQRHTTLQSPEDLTDTAAAKNPSDTLTVDIPHQQPNREETAELSLATPNSLTEQASIADTTCTPTVDTPHQPQHLEENELPNIVETGTRPMYTGREPWVGTRIRVIGGHFKGLFGVIKHTNIDWSLLDTIIDLTPGVDLSHVPSGLLFDVILDVINMTQPYQKIDYRDVVEHDSWKHLNSWRPMNHYHEVWYLRPDLPDPTPRLVQYEYNAPQRPITPRPVTPPSSPPSETYNMDDPWNPAAELPPTQKDHWILHPQLVGLELEVEIKGGIHDSKGESVPVKVVKRDS
ncbi:hypothetical protein PQX77_001593 [Marasmius sp. AFHP31]|nr:hypothetical protein PQX77_001593 [Marasmius sp. AFHP31]